MISQNYIKIINYLKLVDEDKLSKSGGDLLKYKYNSTLVEMMAIAP